MKSCSYCGQESADDAGACPQCGKREFRLVADPQTICEAGERNIATTSPDPWTPRAAWKLAGRSLNRFLALWGICLSIDSVLFFLLDRVHWGSPWDLPFAGVFFILNFPGMLLTGNPHSWGIPCAVISSLVYAFVIFKIVQFRAQRGAKKIQPNLSSKRKSRTSAGLNQIVIILSLFFFGPRTLAGSEERGVVRNDDPAIKIDIPGTLKELKEALRAGRVTQVDLIHVSNHASFRTTISSDLLKQTYESKVIITNPGSSAYISEFQKLIERLDAAALDRPTDLRWGCIFTMTDRAKPIEIFSDKAGKTGVIDGALVTFKNGDVAQWAEKAFGKVLE